MTNAVLEHCNDLARQLGHLKQRWDNRIVATGPFAKQYLEGCLAVILEFDAKLGSNDYPVFAVYKHLRAGGEDDVGASVGVKQSNASDASQMNDRGKQLVFVSDVQVMDGIEKIVSSSVRLQRSKYFDDLWAGPVYCSTHNRCLKVFETWSEWKVNAGNTESVMPHHVARQDVKRGAQIVNGVSYQERPMLGLGESFLHAQELIAGIRLTINDHNIGVFPCIGQDLPVQIRDVLIGPLNF